MLKMIKKVGAGFLSVLLLLACFASNATALTFSERFEMCKLAMAHANGTITLDRKEIENIKAQSLLDLEMDFKNLALVPDQDIEIMKKFVPQIFSKNIVSIIEIAKKDLPTEQKVEKLVIISGGDCWQTFISLTLGLAGTGAIIFGIGFMLGYLIFSLTHVYPQMLVIFLGLIGGLLIIVAGSILSFIPICLLV